jgi:hypothetical protein
MNNVNLQGYKELYKEALTVDFDKAFNGATVERTYTSESGTRLIVGKREKSPTGKKYVVTHYMFNEGKFSFFWSTYDIETFTEACLIAQAKL